MPSASDRSVFRRDNALFALCVVLSLAMLARPEWGGRVAGLIRASILRPFLGMQEWAESARTARVSLGQLRLERDSAIHAAQFLPSLRAENERLRALLGLSQRLGTSFIPADVLHQPLPTDGRTLLLSAGAREGVRAFDVVVAAEGLLGVVQTVEQEQSVAMTWAHPEFRSSALAQPGDVFGIVAPALETVGSEQLLQLRGVAIRDSLPVGTAVFTSGLGGVFPPGIPVGTVLGPAPEETGWERVYLLRPAAYPGVGSQVLIVRGGTRTDLRRSFEPEAAR